MKEVRILFFGNRQKLVFLIACFLGILILSWSYKSTAFADDINSPKEIKYWWLEIGSDIGYQRSNAWYATQKDFWISILAAKGGYRFDFKKIPFLYIDPYFKAELWWDLGNNDQNKFFWNNNLRYGPGVRVRAEYREKCEDDKEKIKDKKEKCHKDYNIAYPLRVNYANLDYFIEYLGINFIDRGQSVPDNIPRNDFRTGLNSWVSIDNNINFGSTGLRGGIWFEMWGDLTYHSTNFFMDGKDNFNILTLSPKAGLRMAYGGVALEPYFRFDYVRDILDKDWNKEAWSNNTKYGPGIRLSLGGLTKRDNTSIYIYAEYVKIDYDSRVGLKSAGLSTDDFRAGINLWIPFGASSAPSVYH